MNYRTAEKHLRVDLKSIIELVKAHSNHCYMEYNEYYNGQKIMVFVEADLNQRYCKLNGKLMKLTTTPCNYGSIRYWFTCPVCGGRCRVIYWQGQYDYWACRKCLKLVYRSQQATKSDFVFWYDKAIKVAHIIDSNFDAEPMDLLFCSHLWWLFPDKPKYMKLVKYEHLRNQFCKYAENGQRLDQQELARLKLKL